MGKNKSKIQSRIQTPKKVETAQTTVSEGTKAGNAAEADLDAAKAKLLAAKEAEANKQAEAAKLAAEQEEADRKKAANELAAKEAELAEASKSAKEDDVEEGQGDVQAENILPDPNAIPEDAVVIRATSPLGYPTEAAPQTAQVAVAAKIYSDTLPTSVLQHVPAGFELDLIGREMSHVRNEWFKVRYIDEADVVEASKTKGRKKEIEKRVGYIPVEYVANIR